jgi:hypothetical protein
MGNGSKMEGMGWGRRRNGARVTFGLSFWGLQRGKLSEATTGGRPPCGRGAEGGISVGAAREGESYPPLSSHRAGLLIKITLTYNSSLRPIRVKWIRHGGLRFLR